MLFQYEGDVLPYSPEGGWTQGSPCEGGCGESLGGGYFVLRWDGGTDGAGYLRRVAQPPNPPPPTLWVEWRYSSNHPFLGIFDFCDGHFLVDYKLIGDQLLMFGDAVISFDGGNVLSGLPINEFRTFRFESTDGTNYCFFVDGHLFTCGHKSGGDDFANVGFSGSGGCDLDLLPTVNRWDFVRYGTIGYGESIVATDPPGPAIGGFIDARTHPALDRFTVTFDQPNYMYVDEIAVEATAGVAPTVTATRRQDNGPPETVEIVLDRPIPYNATTRFTFNDGTIEQTVELTYAPGDTDGDGDANLSDLASFQNCFGTDANDAPCPVLDFDTNEQIEDSDFAAFQPLLSGQ